MAVTGVLHKDVTDHWPKEESDYASSQPETYFNYGKQYITNYKSDDSAPHVLYSMMQMAEKSIIEENKYQTLIDAACALWGHDRKEALGAIKNFDILPQQLDAAPTLLDSVDPDSEVEVSALEEAWNTFSERTSQDEDFRVLIAILNKSAKRSSKRADVGLQLWTSAAGLSEADVLQRTALSEQLNDEQRKRVGLQIEGTAEELGSDVFLGLLPDYFELPDSRQA